jgi:hypothetical protein
MTVPDPKEHKEVKDDINIEKLENGKIVCYTIKAGQAKTFERWGKLVHDTLSAWPEDQPYLAIHDISEHRVALPYSVYVNFELFNIGASKDGIDLVLPIIENHPDFTARIAILTNTTHSGNVARAATKFKGQIRDRIDYKLFFDRDKAITWLLG